MSTDTVWKHWNVIGSLRRYMLKHAAAVCRKTNCSVHYRTTSLHHAPTDLRLNTTVIKPGKKRKEHDWANTTTTLDLGSLASQKLDVLR